MYRARLPFFNIRHDDRPPIWSRRLVCGLTLVVVLILGVSSPSVSRATSHTAHAPYGDSGRISAGMDNTCGVRVDGTVRCWGGVMYKANLGRPRIYVRWHESVQEKR